jgi:SAM-dependent methyltransferase
MSNIATLRDDWEYLANEDAFHAILTDENKAHGRWDVGEFMATGTAEIETVMQHLSRLGIALDWTGSALDFGCGVGRLTQALGHCFASCVGVDIAQGMIEKAESMNQKTNCRFVTNAELCLPFPEASFSFIYCNIVLQHIPRRFAVEYLREFVRVLAPNGVLVFGVQDSFAAPTFSLLAARIRHILHPRSRLRALFGRGNRHMQMHCLSERVVRKALGSAKILDVQFTNTAAKDFNGHLRYLPHTLTSGYIGKQYCVVKQIP